MDLKNLNTFIHVAELNSFTKASTVLGYSQSTVSFQIRQLEEELNCPLFERINHTVVLTEKGREVLTYAHQVSRLTAQLMDSTADSKMLSGHVRLAMSDSLCDYLFPNHFQTFRRNHPGITMKIIAAGTSEMFDMIDRNRVDAILTLDSHIYDANYIIVQEEQVDTHFVAASSNPITDGTPVSLEALVKMPFILTEKGMSYRRLLDEQLAQRSMEITPILEIGNTSLICQLLQQDQVVSFLPDFVTREAVEKDLLRYVNVPDLNVVIWKQLLHHRNKWISPQIESVLQYCIEKEF